MGNWNSGRRPAPTALKVLRGIGRRDRINATEPKPEPARADFDMPPEEIADDPVAVTEWKRVVPLLRVCGVITEAEKPVLIALCQTWSHYCEAQKKIRQLGMLVKGTHDMPVVNPYVKLARHSLAQCARLWIELGLTPSARGRLHTLPAGEQAKLSKWGSDL